jgi:hypothetical protein
MLRSDLRKIQVYCTNAALGHQQYAYLVRLDPSDNGYDYLCVKTLNIPSYDETYVLGEVVKDLEDFYVEEIDWDIKKSPLINNFLFQYFLNDY